MRDNSLIFYEFDPHTDHQIAQLWSIFAVESHKFPRSIQI